MRTFTEKAAQRLVLKQDHKKFGMVILPICNTGTAGDGA